MNSARRLLDGAIERRCGLAFFRIEVFVPRTQGQTVSFTNGGHTFDRNPQVQVRHHSSNDQELLHVLFAKVRALWLDNIQKLEHDGCDCAEVARPELSAEMFTQAPDLHSRQLR